MLRVRRQGKLLAFASVHERSYTGAHVTAITVAEGEDVTDVTDVTEERAPSRPPVGQLIAGRLLSNNVGTETAETLLRQLRPGTVITVVRRCLRRYTYRYTNRYIYCYSR